MFSKLPRELLQIIIKYSENVVYKEKLLVFNFTKHTSNTELTEFIFKYMPLFDININKVQYFKKELKKLKNYRTKLQNKCECDDGHECMC